MIYIIYSISVRIFTTISRKSENYSRDSLLLKGDIHREKTAEEQFNMSARGWLAYPVTPAARATTAEVGL